MTGRAGTYPKGTTMSYFRTVAGTAVIAVVVAIALSTGVAGATGPGTHYTDGTETYEGVFVIDGQPSGPEGYGPPPEAPHFESIDGVSNLCIDPPSFVDITFHFSDRESIVANYNGEVQFHGTNHTCIPLDPPQCTPEDTTDFSVELWATWNIGSGESARLIVNVDCTPEIPASPEVPVPTELAPPAAQTAVPTELRDPICTDEQLANGLVPVTHEDGTGTCELPSTGSSGHLLLLAAFGAALAAIGWTVQRNWDTKNHAVQGDVR